MSGNKQFLFTVLKSLASDPYHIFSEYFVQRTWGNHDYCFKSPSFASIGLISVHRDFNLNKNTALNLIKVDKSLIVKHLHGRVIKNIKHLGWGC